jgi:hypothetical protein
MLLLATSQGKSTTIGGIILDSLDENKIRDRELLVLVPDLCTPFFYTLVDLLIVAPFSQCFLINRVSLQLLLFPYWDFASLDFLLLFSLPLKSPKNLLQQNRGLFVNRGGQFSMGKRGQF